MAMKFDSKIAAIKIARDAHPMTLADGKIIIEALEASAVVAEDPLVADIKKMRNEAECYREDLHTLIRLVDFFVAHPDQYAAWKAERP